MEKTRIVGACYRGAKLAQVGGRLPTEIGEEFAISPDSVLRWVKKADLDRRWRQDGSSTLEREELRKLRHELRRLRLEREVLASAAV